MIYHCYESVSPGEKVRDHGRSEMQFWTLFRQNPQKQGIMSCDDAGEVFNRVDMNTVGYWGS